MKQKMYSRKCKDCCRVFDTEKKNVLYCPDCKKYREKKRKKKKAAFLSINDVLRIERVVNKVRNTRYHYGDIVAIIENTKADCCVSCGEYVPEGRMICPQCQKKAKEGK